MAARYRPPSVGWLRESIVSAVTDSWEWMKLGWSLVLMPGSAAYTTRASAKSGLKVPAVAITRGLCSQPTSAPNESHRAGRAVTQPTTSVVWSRYCVCPADTASLPIPK